MTSALRWDRWRLWCGWAALVAAGCWVAKFGLWAVLAARYTDGKVDDNPHGPGVLVVLVAFLLPTAGSLLGVIAGSGVVVPWVRTRRWFVGVPCAILSAVVVTLIFSTVINASATLFADAASQVWKVEGSDLIAAALLTGLGLLLLYGPGVHALPARGSEPAARIREESA